jgi:hypothetical protein
MDLYWGFVPRPPRTFVDISVLMADCIIGNERTALLDAALGDAHGELLRSILGHAQAGSRHAETVESSN